MAPTLSEIRLETFCKISGKFCIIKKNPTRPVDSLLETDEVQQIL